MYIVKAINYKLLLTILAIGIIGAIWYFSTNRSFSVSAQEVPQALAAGAVDCFLKIEGIKGESEDKGHKEEIELESFSWGETNAASHASGGGGGAGKVSMQDFHFVSKFSKASPKLFLGVATGEHFKEAQMSCRKAGKEQQEFLKWTMKDILISSYKTGADDHQYPVDSFSLNFAEIEVEYKQQKPDGSLGPSEKAGWDLKQNKSL